MAASEAEDRRGQETGGCTQCSCPGFKSDLGQEELYLEPGKPE